MGKVEDKKKQKSDTLFFSAFNLFTSKGFNETTIADIVKEAGVAKGTFYLYFKDKYDLREKLIAYKASILFQNALDAYLKSELALEEKVRDIEGKMIFFVDNVINQLKNNRPSPTATVHRSRFFNSKFGRMKSLQGQAKEVSAVYTSIGLDNGIVTFQKITGLEAPSILAAS